MRASGIISYPLSFLSLFMLIIYSIQAQETSVKLPYYEIPPVSGEFTPGKVAARVMDGLGYRYYWATEGLTEKDLAYKPSEDGRTTRETIDHIYGLSKVIVNAPLKQFNVPSANDEKLTFDETRKRTLENIRKASGILRNSSEEDVKEYLVIFKNGDDHAEFPYWNLLNGPIADAIYHTGQVVSFRRTSGNPINPKVNVFIGKTGE